MDPTRIRQKIRRFRILVIGRANAGKTTILQRVCNTRDNPEIYNGAGEKIDAAILTASRERGEHDIENEMVFQSNPGFVFHDSRGFEAGGESEFIKVKEFIAARSKETRLENRLHAIWYCIPMDEASRSFTQAEIKFFSQCDTGSIPVIVLFTKFDALYDVEFRKLRQEGKPRKDAKELAPKRAEDSFAKGPQLKFLKDVPWPPKCHVYLPDMDKDDADCRPLIERTAGTLDDEVVEQLFVSTQKTNLELCMKYAAERILGRFFDSADTVASEGHANIIGRLGAWFPHLWVPDVDLFLRFDRDFDRLRDDYDDGFDGADYDGADYDFFLEKFDRSHREEMESRLLSAVSGSSPLKNIVQLISAVVVIFEHSFYIFDKRRYLQNQQESAPSFYVALDHYMSSSHAAAVREAVSIAVQEYEAAVTTAAHAYEVAVTTVTHTSEEAVRTLPTWRAKLPFERFKKKVFERSKEKEKEAFKRSKAKEKEALCSQAVAELIKTILETTLNHRLPRP